MKVHILSDLHFENSPYPPAEMINQHEADVLILAGDITLPAYLCEEHIHSETYARTKKFFDKMCHQYRKVVYVLGNHEFYKSDINDAQNDLQVFLNSYPNVHILENNPLSVDGITFIGGTLWTNYNKGNPLSMHASQLHMNDYKVINNRLKQTTYSYEHKKIVPQDLLNRHNYLLSEMQKSLNQTEGKVVVVTHHAPSYLSVANKHKVAGLVNDSYYSDLSNFILKNPKIKLWVHGHMHDSFDYMIGETRVICEPRGYRFAYNSKFNPQLVVEI